MLFIMYCMFIIRLLCVVVVARVGLPWEGFVCLSVVLSSGGLSREGFVCLGWAFLSLGGSAMGMVCLSSGGFVMDKVCWGQGLSWTRFVMDKVCCGKDWS